MKISNKVSIIAFGASVLMGLTGPAIALAAGPAGVNLGSAGNFVILSKTGISTTGSTAVVGDLGLSPAAATYITGFALVLPAASAFSTSAQVTGKVYAPGYADPTPANLTTAVLDMQTAYTDGAGRTNPTATELGAGNIGGMTLAPGLYKWGTGVTIPTDVTLSGGANDVWIFQVAQNLNISSAVKIVLAGGAQASNVFWVVAGQTTIGTTAVFNGNILDQTAIVLNTGATLTGRALAQTAVTLDSNMVTMPSSTSGGSVIPTLTPTATSTQTSTSTATSTYTASPLPDQTQMQTSTTVSPDPRIASVQAQIKTLSAALLSLQQIRQQNSSVAVPAVPTVDGSVRAIMVDLKKGSNDASVKTLQQFLITQSKGPAAQALTVNGATNYFGGLTHAALAEFQASVGIMPATGNFGPLTRAYLSAHY